MPIGIFYAIVRCLDSPLQSSSKSSLGQHRTSSLLVQLFERNSESSLRRSRVLWITSTLYHRFCIVNHPMIRWIFASWDVFLSFLLAPVCFRGFHLLQLSFRVVELMEQLLRGFLFHWRIVCLFFYASRVPKLHENCETGSTLKRAPCARSIVSLRFFATISNTVFQTCSCNKKHTPVLVKMIKLSFRNPVLTWFVSYLSRRIQIARILLDLMGHLVVLRGFYLGYLRTI